MLPDRAMNDPTDMHAMGAITSGDVFHWHVGRAQFADGTDVSFGEFGGAVLASDTASPVTDHVGEVFADRGPTQIGGAVIVAVSIPMSDTMLSGWAWPVERRADDDMHGNRVVRSKRHLEIAPLPGRSQDDARERVLPPDAVDKRSIHRPHAAQAGCFVVGMAGHRAPFLGGRA